jgi:hypothetical protein
MPLLSFDAYMQKVNATPANEAIPAIQGGFLLVLRFTIGNHNADCIMLIGKWRYKIMCNNVIYSPLRQQT